MYNMIIWCHGGDSVTKAELFRLTINLPKTLIDSVDNYADSMNINRTSAIAVLLSQALNTQQAMADMTKLTSMLEQKAKGEN